MADPLAAQHQPFVSTDSMPSVSPPGVPMDYPPQGSQNAVGLRPGPGRYCPDGLMYKNYLASNEEARLGSQLYHSKQVGWTWDANLGGHVGIVRYGTQDPAWPEGWQLDAEAVAVARLDSSRSLVSTDYRAGFPLTRREGPGNSSSATTMLVRTWATSI